MIFSVLASPVQSADDAKNPCNLFSDVNVALASLKNKFFRTNRGDNPDFTEDETNTRKSTQELSLAAASKSAHGGKKRRLAEGTGNRIHSLNCLPNSNSPSIHLAADMDTETSDKGARRQFKQPGARSNAEVFSPPGRSSIEPSLAASSLTFSLPPPSGSAISGDP